MITVFMLTIVLTITGCQSKNSKEELSKSEVVEKSEQGKKDEEESEIVYPNETTIETEIDPAVQAEGTPNSAPVDVGTSEAYQVGDSITMGDGLYELSIDEVKYTEQRDEYTQDPGNVILVTYTYKNLSDEALLIDDMRFQLMQEDEKTLYDSYYLPDGKMAEPVEKGKSCTAQISYAVPEKTDSIVLAYQDSIHTELAPVKIIVNNLQ